MCILFDSNKDLSPTCKIRKRTTEMCGVKSEH